MAQVKAGWSMPLEVDIRFRLPEVASAMQAGYDASGLGQKTGKLRKALGSIANYKLFKRDIRITLRFPYARIQDAGGRIPDRMAGKLNWVRTRSKKYAGGWRAVAGASRMHFHAYGREWFLFKAKGFDMKAKHYIAQGAGEIARRFNAGRGLLSVRWKKDKKSG